MYLHSFVSTVSFFIGGSLAAATLEGVVVNHSGQPLGGAAVALVADVPTYTTEDDWQLQGTATTSADGEFRLNAPDTGAWALVAHAPGFRRAKFPVNVQAAANRRVGIRLEPGTPVQGRVTSIDGEPLRNALIGPLTTTIETTPDLAGRVLPEWVRTDADGRFAFAATLPNVALTFPVQLQGYESAMIRVEPGETEVNFQLRPGGHSLTGSIYATDRPPQTYGGTHVRAQGDLLNVITKANENSEYRFEGLPPGEYSLSALFPEARASRSPKVELPRDEGTSLGIQVTSGYYVRGRVMDAETSTPAVSVGLRIRDAYTTSGADGYFAAGPYYEPFQVIPEVMETSGYALADPEAPLDLPMSDGFTDITNMEVQVRVRRSIRVNLFNTEITTVPVTVNMLAPNRRPVRTQATSTTMDMHVYHAGDYLVYASSGDFASEAVPVRVGKTGTEINLSMAPGARLEGRVLMAGDALSTRPMTFTIRLKTADEGSSAVLLSETHPTAMGWYRFPVLPAGQFIAEAENNSATRREVQSLTLRPGETLALDFVIEPGNTFAGMVMDSDANPVPAVHITFYYREGGFGQISADDRGRFRAEDLLTSSVINVQVEHYGFAPYRAAEVQLPREDFVINLEREGILRVRVEAPGDTRWAVQLMETRPWGTGGYAEQWMGNSIGQARIDGGETTEFPIPQADRLRVVAISDTGDIAVSPTFTSQEVKQSEREIVLSPGQQGSIFGSVGATGVAVEVTAWNTSLPDGTVATEFKVQTENGNYEIRGLPPGDYLVLAMGDGVNASAENVELAAGENKRVDLQAQVAATIQGRVVLAGEGVSRAEVEMLSESNPSFQPRRVTTNAQGEFMFQDVLPDGYLVRVTRATAGGELKAQRTARVTRSGGPPPVLLDLTPVRPVLLVVPEGMGIAPGNEISLVNTTTREIIQARWVEDGLEAPAPPGQYEIWSGDAVAGTVEVNENGTGRLIPPTP